MSDLDRAARGIDEDVHGANGDLDRGQIIGRAAANLVDYVYESLLEYGEDGFGYGAIIDQGVYHAIERIVAVAMLAQHQVDEEMLGHVVEGLTEQVTWD